MEIAIKEIVCSSPVDIEAANIEADLLQRLAEGSDAKVAESRIPALVAKITDQLTPECCRVRLAMTRVKGVPLDSFLREEAEKESLKSVQTGAVPSRKQRLQRGCFVARELILQLAPVMGHIATMAFHRDVNWNNILVDSSCDLKNLHFGLVDFGLAVNMQLWRGPLGKDSWQLVDIGGDCRYWPMSAWIQFECGWNELDKHPFLAAEYENRLDHHAIGLVALQALVGLCPPLAADTAGIADGEQSLPADFDGLLDAWSQYWDEAILLWTRLLECFRTGGDQDALKLACASEGAHNQVGHALVRVRDAARQALASCDAGGGEEGPDAAPVLRAVLELLSVAGSSGVEDPAEGDEAVRPPPSWETIASIAAGGTTAVVAQGTSPRD